MKKNKLFILLLPFLLSGCNEKQTITSMSDSNTPNNSNDIVFDDITPSLSGAISVNKLQKIIDEVINNTIYDIKSSSISMSKITFETVLNDAEKNDDNNYYSLSLDKKYYENSVLVTTIKGESSEDYQCFGYFNDKLGKLAKKYVYIDEKFEKIITCNEFTSIDSSKEIKFNSDPYDITSFDKYFLVESPDAVFETATEYNLAGYLNDEVVARKITEFKSGSNTYKNYFDYYFKDNKLTKIVRYSVSFLNDKEENAFEKKTSISTFSYSNNGIFDKNLLPK